MPTPKKSPLAALSNRYLRSISSLEELHLALQSHGISFLGFLETKSREQFGCQRVVRLEDRFLLEMTDLKKFFEFDLSGKLIREVPSWETIPPNFLNMAIKSGKSLAPGNLSIPRGVRYVGSFAFCKCIDLVRVDIPDSVKVIFPMAFCFSGLEDLVIPGSVIHIGWGAFDGCVNCRSVTCPSRFRNVNRRKWNIFTPMRFRKFKKNVFHWT